jgi:hypothetical protein
MADNRDLVVLFILRSSSVLDLQMMTFTQFFEGATLECPLWVKSGHFALQSPCLQETASGETQVFLKFRQSFSLATPPTG